MSNLAASLLVFTTSASVLVLEILAGRLLAPYVGVTLETFTGIIGTILAGIALGNWLGGRAVDERDPRVLLPLWLVGGGISALASPFLVDLFGSSVPGSGPGSIVFLAFVAFFLPAALLSAVTPTVVKLQLSTIDETGTVVGRLSALGTAGALVGTFVTGFLLLATAPSRPIVLVVGGGLVITGLALGVRLPGSASKATGGTLALAIMAAGLTSLSGGPCETETAYFCARVEVDPARESGRLLWLDNLRHSYVDLDDPAYLEFSYTQALSDVLASVKPGQALDVLHVGGGGFTMPRYLTATRPGSTHLVLELDPAIVRLARDELGLVAGPELQVRTGDARVTLRSAERAAYDVAVIDAFGGPSVPWHLTTAEFVNAVKDTLRPGGVYTLNLIDYPPLGFAKAEAATLATVFDHVLVLAPPERLDGSSGGNFVVAASDRPLDVAAILARNAARGDDEAAISDPEGLDAWLDGALVLRDAFAPVDQLLTPRPS